MNLAKKKIRNNLNVYINRLDKLSESGLNGNAKVNAMSNLLTLAKSVPRFTQKITLKNDESSEKDYLQLLHEQKKKKA